MIITSDTPYWENMLSLPLAARLSPAPVELIDHITMVNAATDRPFCPMAVVVPMSFLQDVRSAVDEMPAVVRKMLEGELLGVYFAQGLGSSAVTDVVARSDGTLIGSFVALDLDAFLNRTANEWATWKENTPFSPAPHMTLQAFIAEPEDDNRKNALQYLLLHEFGHVLTTKKSIVTDWWSPPEEMQAHDAYSFLPLTWQITESREIIPRPENEFPLRRHVVFYHEPLLSTDALLAVYDGLQSTNFATLYAATNVYDDFAESFASYVHSVLMKKRSEIHICCDGILIMQTENFWASNRCAEKFQFLSNFLNAG